MPGGDRTGPRGMGPMTGRGLGYCAGYDVPGTMAPGPGLGLGRGWGRGWRAGGRGWRHMYYATGLPGWARYGHPWAGFSGPYGQPVSGAQETEILKNQADMLQRELEAINKRLEDLEEEA